VTVFQQAQFELARFQHNHGGGQWHDMNEVTPGHDAAEADPERQWARGRIFRCSTCEDEIRVDISDAGASPSARTNEP
jgi:hypothetical protein